MGNTCKPTRKSTRRCKTTQKRYIQPNTKYQKEGNTYKIIWQNQQVGEFTGPDKPTPFEKLEHESINLKFIDSSLKRGTPFEKLKLFDGLANTCACGEYGLKKGAFIKHIKQYHNGIALPLS